MQLVSKAKCEQILISSDFSLSHIDWSTGTAISNDAIHNHFLNAVKDNVLWWLVHFPTRINNTLDLVLTTIPDKVTSFRGFDDTFNSDHKIFRF